MAKFRDKYWWMFEALFCFLWSVHLPIHINIRYNWSRSHLLTFFSLLHVPPLQNKSRGPSLPIKRWFFPNRWKVKLTWLLLSTPGVQRCAWTGADRDVLFSYDAFCFQAGWNFYSEGGWLRHGAGHLWQGILQHSRSQTGEAAGEVDGYRKPANTEVHDQVWRGEFVSSSLLIYACCHCRVCI